MKSIRTYKEGDFKKIFLLKTIKTVSKGTDVSCTCQSFAKNYQCQVLTDARMLSQSQTEKETK